MLDRQGSKRKDMGQEPVLLIPDVLEACLKFDVFSGLPWDGPQIIPDPETDLAGWRLKGSAPGLETTIPGPVTPIQEVPRPSLRVLRLRWECTGCMTHWKQDCRFKQVPADCSISYQLMAHYEKSCKHFRTSIFMFFTVLACITYMRSGGKHPHS